MQPLNELGVIVLFAQQAEQAGFEIVSIQATFPDAIVSHNEQRYRVEFEFQAMNFKAHEHDPSYCDFIICWENDWPESPLPVMALNEDSWQETDISLTARLAIERNHWRDRALKAEGQLNATRPKNLDGTVGRPRILIDPAKLDYYLEHGPGNVSIREAKEVLALSRRIHYRHRDAAIYLARNKEN